MKTEKLLTVLKIFAWVAFFGYVAQAGGYLISYAVSCIHPEASGNLYQGLNLLKLQEYSFVYYTLMIVIAMIIASLKSVVWWKVIKVISKIKLESPFTNYIARRLELISYLLLIIWMVGMAGSAYAKWLSEYTTGLQINWNTGEFLFMAGLVFIISQVFKRGVEIQSENDLTV